VSGEKIHTFLVRASIASGATAEHANRHQRPISARRLSMITVDRLRSQTRDGDNVAPVPTSSTASILDMWSLSSEHSEHSESNTECCAKQSEPPEHIERCICTTQYYCPIQ
jgi:hypothetical protein